MTDDDLKRIVDGNGLWVARVAVPATQVHSMARELLERRDYARRIAHKDRGLRAQLAATLYHDLSSNEMRDEYNAVKVADEIIAEVDRTAKVQP